MQYIKMSSDEYDKLMEYLSNYNWIALPESHLRPKGFTSAINIWVTNEKENHVEATK